MATVILDFEFDGDKITKSLEQLTAELIKNQQEIKKSKKEFDNGNLTLEEFSAIQVKSRATTKELSSQIKALEKEQSLLTIINNTATGSYDNLNAQYQLAQRELKELEGTIKTNEDGTKELTDEYIALSAKVKQAKDAIDNFGDGISDSTSRVGQYEQSITKALEKQKEQAKQFQDDAKNIKIFGVSINDLEKGFDGFKKSIKGGVSTLDTLKTALAATGIGLLLIAFGALQAFLTKTKKGVELLEQVTNGFGAVVGVLIDGVAFLGESLLNAVQNPKKAFEDLVDFVKKTVIDQFQALAKILQGIVTFDTDIIKEGFNQLPIVQATKAVGEYGKKVAEAAQLAADLTKQAQKLRDTQRNANIEFARQNIEIDKLRKSAENVSLTEQERIKNLQKANEIIEAQAKRRLELARENLRIIEQQNAISDSSAEDLDKQAEAEKEVLAIERELGNLQAENINKLEKLRKEARQKEEAERAKRIAEAEKRKAQIAKDAVAETEIKLLEVERGSKLELELLKQLEIDKRNLALTNFKGTEAERRLIIAQSNRAIKDLEDSFDAQQKEREAKKAEVLKKDLFALEKFRSDLELKRLNEIASNNEKEIALRIDAFEKIREVALSQLEIDRQIALSNEQITAEQRLLIIEQFEAKRSEIISQNESQIESIKKSSQDKILANEKEAIEQQLAFERAAAEQSIGLSKDVANLLNQQNEQVIALQKAIALVEIGINLQRELSAIAVLAASNPANAATFGAAGAAQQATLSSIAIARSAIAAATVLAFEEGGLLEGKSHANGGIKGIVRSTGQFIEAEGGEFIVNKEATAQYLPLIEAINNSVKPNGFKVPSRAFFEQGGRIASEFATNRLAQNQNAEQKITVDLNLTELNRSQNQLQTNFSDASLSPRQR